MGRIILAIDNLFARCTQIEMLRIKTDIEGYLLKHFKYFKKNLISRSKNEKDQKNKTDKKGDKKQQKEQSDKDDDEDYAQKCRNKNQI